MNPLPRKLSDYHSINLQHGINTYHGKNYSMKKLQYIDITLSLDNYKFLYNIKNK